jgi:hypothetical protein
MQKKKPIGSGQNYGPEKLMALHFQVTSTTITILNAYEYYIFLPMKQLKMASVLWID